MEDNMMQNPYYAKAMEFIKKTDLNSLEPGKHILDGENLFVNIVDGKMRTPQEARLEVHDRYIDIQVPLSKRETYGVKPRSECLEPDGGYDAANDIMFYKDPVTDTISADPGEIVTFAPDTAHAPLIGEGTVRKAIFKVLVAG